MRGLAPSIIKCGVTSGTFFSTLYFIEENIKKLNIMSEGKVHFTSSCMARVVQSVISNPIILIKSRLEVIGFNEYNSIMDAVRKIYLQEGFLGFWTGIKVSLIRDVPFSGTFYPIYNFIKVYLARLYELKYGQLQGNDRLKALACISSIASFSANVLSCAITHPLDLIRTRIFF